jgi:glycosyltransferase involved in cell wall biosynthesis
LNILLSAFGYYPYCWGGTEVYVKGLASYLKMQGHNVTIVVGVPDEAFKDHPVFFEDDQLKILKYQYNNTDIIGAVLKNSNTTEIYSKFRQQWQHSWLNIITRLGTDRWDILHVHAFTSTTGEALIKAVKIHSPEAEIIASCHLPVSCVKGTLLYANTMKECEEKPAINVCTACLISNYQHLPIGIAKAITTLLPMLQSEKIATRYRIKTLVKEFLDSFTRNDYLIDRWHVFNNQILKVMKKSGIPSDKIILLSHGVHPVFFQQDNKNTRVYQPPVIFLYASRFVKIKGFITLLQAWCSIPACSRRVLYMVGNIQTPSEEEEVCLRKASARTDIHWLGEKSQEQLAVIIKAVHCVIIPSECVEIGPLIYLEAIASGANVIAANIGGCREFALLYPVPSNLFEAGNKNKLALVIKNFSYIPFTSSPVRQSDNYQKVLSSYSTMKHINEIPS